ncbi:tRNA-binding protein [soil metagenome]
MTGTVTPDQFFAVDIRVGRVVAAEPFPEARKPAIKLTIDFGEIGVKRSSAQLTRHYTPQDLVGRLVVGVVNFPPRQIGPFVSEVLVLGACPTPADVILLAPDLDVAPGTRIA